MEPSPELMSTLAQAMVGVADGRDWSSVTVVANAITSQIEADCVLRLRGGTPDRLSVATPMAANRSLRDMRIRMASPDRGTWFSAIAVATRGASLELDFNYHDKPEWDIEPDDEAQVEDLQEFPLPWDGIPAWHPVRRLFTEESWEAFRGVSAT